MKKTKVRINTPVAGLTDSTYDLEDFSFIPGQVVELHPKLAAAWIASGTATAEEEEEEENNEEDGENGEPETTSLEAGETAVLSAPKPRKRGRPKKRTE